MMYALPIFFNGYTMKVLVYILPHMVYVIHMALLGSIYSTVALAVERFIAVCYPFLKYRRIYSSSCFIIPVVLFSVVYNIPKYFELTLVWPVALTTPTEPDNLTISIEAVSNLTMSPPRLQPAKFRQR